MSRTSVFDCVPSDVVSVKAVDFERMMCAAGIEVPADCVMSDSLYMRVAALSVPLAVRDAFMFGGWGGIRRYRSETCD